MKSASGANRNIAYVKEPSFYAWPATEHLFLKLLRTTGDTVKGTQATQTSNELRAGRLESAPIQGRESSSGDISAEWSFGSFDDFFAALLSNTWADFTATTDSSETYPVYKVVDDPADESLNEVEAIGASRKAQFLTLATGDAAVDTSFITERDFTDITEGLRRYYRGVRINTCTISIPLDSQPTISFGIMGADNPRGLTKAYIDDKIENGTADEKVIYARIKSRIYDSETPTITDQFSSFVGTLKFFTANGTDISDIAYATQLDCVVTNNMEVENVILQKRAFGITEQKFGVTGTLTVRLLGSTLMNAAIDWDTVKIVFSLRDAAGNRYQCTISQAKLTDVPDGVSGPGPITIAFPFTAFGTHSFDIIKIPAEVTKFPMKAPVAVAVPSISAVSSEVTLYDNLDYDATYSDPVDTSVSAANRQIFYRFKSQPSGSALATSFTQLAASGDSISGIVAGKYTMEMYAKDASGVLDNSRTVEFSFEVTVPTLLAPLASYTSPTITFTSGYTPDPTGWAVHYELGAAGAAASTIPDPTISSPTGATKDLTVAGDYYIKAIAVSTSLNTSPVGTYGPFTFA